MVVTLYDEVKVKRFHIQCLLNKLDNPVALRQEAKAFTDCYLNPKRVIKEKKNGKSKESKK
jgi:hypothetical protein